MKTDSFDVLVIGGGPAGLCACAELSRCGIKVLLVDEGPVLGGQLVKQTHKFFGSREHYAGVRGIEIPDKLQEEIDEKLITVYSSSTVVGIYPPNNNVLIYRDQKKVEEHSFKYIIIATGASENMILFENNDLPGIYGAGAVQTLMNQYGIIPGKNMLMVGAGNIGLIVSYQLLQAGCRVKKLIEAAPSIGGYLVHASKIIRMGIPVQTSTTILKAIGTEKVEGAITVKLDENWNQIEGTEEEIEVDTICLSVGLAPSYKLAVHAGCKQIFIRELGGMIPWRNSSQETSVNGIYIAGDACGVEEASSAMIEGRLAGLNIAKCMKRLSEKACNEKIDDNLISLDKLRSGPFGERIVEGIRKLEGKSYE